MLFHDPPAVRVPTLEPSAAFVGSALLRSNVPDRPLSHARLSDYYRPAQVAEADSASLSPSPRQPRALRSASLQHTPQRSRSPEPPHSAGSARARPSPVSWSALPPRDNSPRPAWNQNRPPQRARPTVSAPRTEPRRFSREASEDARKRPWLEGAKRAEGAGTVKTPTSARKDLPPAPRPEPQAMAATNANAAGNADPAKKASANGYRHANASCPTSAAREGMALLARVEFLERALQDAQQRAARAEACCDEVHVMMQSMTMQHFEAMARLEKRTLQLAAQVHCLMQSNADAKTDAPPVERCLSAEVEIEAEEEEEEAKSESETMAVQPDDHSAAGFDTTSAAEAMPRETVVRGTAVRVPPMPPMALQWGQHPRRTDTAEQHRSR